MEIRRYLDRVSGPLLDRIDIQVEADAVPVKEIHSAEMAESSQSVRERVAAARRIQQARYREAGFHCNARLTNKGIQQYCRLDEEAEQLLKVAMENLRMSMRAHQRILKVSRTIADLEGSEIIRAPHLAEAIQYRELDQKYWS